MYLFMYKLVEDIFFTEWCRLTHSNLETRKYYMVQTLECTFIQGCDKIVMVIC